MGYNPGGGVLTIQDEPTRVKGGRMVSFQMSFGGKDGKLSKVNRNLLTISVFAYIV